MPKLMPKTGTPVRAKWRSAYRIEPSPPSTMQRSSWRGSESTTSSPAACSPCLAISSAVATSRQPASPAPRPPLDRLGRPRRMRWVISAATRSAHGSTSCTRRLEVVERLARRRPPEEGLEVAFRARAARRGEPAHRQAELTSGAATQIASRRSAGVADDAPADPLRPSSNCGLTIASTRRRAQAGTTAGSTLVSEMKETSIVASSGAKGRSSGAGRGR